MLQHQKSVKGQALVEFALIAPILLFVVMGILDFGRVLFAYAMASNSLRTALRSAEVLGYESVPTYLDCVGMDEIARKVFFINDQNIQIQYAKPDGTVIDCAAMTPDNLDNGDMLQIQTQVTINFITPIANRLVPSLNLHFAGERTIVKEIALNGDETLDSDYDGLRDDWEKLNFGDLSQTGTDDPDGDGCNNGCEETRDLNPNLADTDGEGLSDGDEIYIYHTDPKLQDTDTDGLTDYNELFTYKTDPLDADSEGDGLNDGDEILYGTDPHDPDSDDDTISDGNEVHDKGTDPKNQDTDGDGLSDFEETVTYGTNPLNPDSDADGLGDKAEITLTTKPLIPDTDGDTLLDGAEVNTYRCNPLLVDTDGDSLKGGAGPLPDNLEVEHNTYCHHPDTDADGLTDAEEIYQYGTDPLNPDTDGDGARDGDEIYRYHTDPRVFNTPEELKDAELYDTDNDGLADEWERMYFGDLRYTGTDDPDGEKCDNECEEMRGTNPTQADTDSDGLDDYEEVYAYGTDPLDSDSDDEGLTDGQEVDTYRTDPKKPDTDGDGLTDYEEAITYKTDPMKPDTDGDGLNDYEEAITYKTDPTKPDTDSDTLTDSEEIRQYKSDPTKPDTDGETLLDGVEVKTYFTDPTRADTETDGLNDFQEVMTYQTDPLKVDTDGDSLTDYEEVMQYKTDPLKADTDGDRLNDGGEVKQYTTDPLKADTDADKLSDGAEIYDYKTNPLAQDTDGELLKDGDEVLTYFCNPALPDTDGDTLNDYDETFVHHTDCAKADSDGDGKRDDQELHDGTLPTNVVGIRIDNLSITAPKKATQYNFTVTLTNPSLEITTVWYETKSSTATSASGDFVYSAGKLIFYPGVTTQTLPVLVYPNKKGEGLETFYVELTNPTNSFLEVAQGIGTILP
ncbi:MAG TPA: TadE/TadG family type IV pilus assembly protein [Phototrophicaceae bacterium]|nr:TadE/TadG family type IV pilus assembly protein [Phototrophicaceae bacterium]